MSENRGGRPPKLDPDDKTLKLLTGLGSILCTINEAAAALSVTKPTLLKFFDDHPEAREAFDMGQNQGRMSLRRKQFALAEKNAAMAIFLGKNYLGQKDQADVAFTGTLDLGGAAATLAAKLARHVGGLVSAPDPGADEAAPGDGAA